jgi:hypothetical protein
MALQNSISSLYLAAKLNIAQLLVLVTLAAAKNPTQQAIDAAVTAINTGTYSGPLVPKPTYTLDGESYDWGAYLSQLTTALEKINDLIQRESLPWRVRSYASP